MVKIGLILPKNGMVPRWFNDLIMNISLKNLAIIANIHWSDCNIDMPKSTASIGLEYKVFKYYYSKRNRVNHIELVPVDIDNLEVEAEFKSEVDLYLSCCDIGEVEKLACKYGVWEFFINNYPYYKFKKLLSEHAKRDFFELQILCRNNGKLHEVYKNKVKISRSYWINLNNFYSRFIQAILYLIRTGSFKETSFKEINEYEAKTEQHNEYIQYIKVIAKAICHTFNRKFWKGKSEWGIYYGNNTKLPDSELDAERVKYPNDRFLADPFPVIYNDKLYVFAEEFVYEEGKGNIVALEEKNNYLHRVDVVLEEVFHLSYPFIFKYDNEHYMIPESNCNGDIRLYSCKSFPNKWEFKKTLIKGVRAVDTTIAFHDDRWWMFTNIKRNGWSFDEQLFIYHCENPIMDEWKPHKMNPVVLSSRNGRMAGKIFCRDHTLYRPSQDCSEYYGGAVNIMKIIELNEDSYKEELFHTIYPSKGKKGVHTYNEVGSYFIIDAY